MYGKEAVCSVPRPGSVQTALHSTNTGYVRVTSDSSGTSMTTTSIISFSFCFFLLTFHLLFSIEDVIMCPILIVLEQEEKTLKRSSNKL